MQYQQFQSLFELNTHSLFLFASSQAWTGSIESTDEDFGGLRDILSITELFKAAPDPRERLQPDIGVFVLQ